jgi:hypothetical protein
MDANEIEKVVSGLINFGGIFKLCQLKKLKIVSYPVSIIVNIDAHWISVFISNNNIEIMDSLGYFDNKNIDKILCELLGLHIKYKNFSISPSLQNPDSDTCAKFAICFLIYKTLTDNSLCKFCQNFSSDLNSNDDIINEIFETVLKIK